MCPSPLVLAQQLTHIELERLSMIGPEEFVQAFAKETDKVTKSLLILVSSTQKTSNRLNEYSFFSEFSKSLN